jgi:hypothetical protein
LVAHRGVHGRADGAVGAGAVDTLGEAVGDRLLGAREVQRDAVVLERAGQVFERLQAGGVDVRHRLGVQDERGRDGRRAVQCFLHSAFDVAGVGEEQAIVEPVHDDARRDLGVIVARDVGPASERVDPAEDDVVGRALRRTTSTIYRPAAKRIASSTPVMITASRDDPTPGGDALSHTNKVTRTGLRMPRVDIASDCS